MASRSISGIALLMAILTTTITEGRAEEGEHTTGSSLRIAVRVFNYAQAPFETWKYAQIVATRIFDRAGIETVWMYCALSTEGQFLHPGCELPPQPGEIFLRLVPLSNSTSARFGHATLGISAPSEKGTPASASIFYNRVEELAKGGAAPVAVILGHVSAHEIGHLLLSPNSHSPMGLMSGKWSRSNLQLANDGQLNFLQSQAVLLQQNVLGRSVQRTSENDDSLRGNHP